MRPLQYFSDYAFIQWASTYLERMYSLALGKQDYRLFDLIYDVAEQLDIDGNFDCLITLSDSKDFDPTRPELSKLLPLLHHLYVHNFSLLYMSCLSLDMRNKKFREWAKEYLRAIFYQVIALREFPTSCNYDLWDELAWAAKKVGMDGKFNNLERFDSKSIGLISLDNPTLADFLFPLSYIYCNQKTGDKTVLATQDRMCKICHKGYISDTGYCGYCASFHDINGTSAWPATASLPYLGNTSTTTSDYSAFGAIRHKPIFNVKHSRRFDDVPVEKLKVRMESVVLPPYLGSPEFKRDLKNLLIECMRRNYHGVNTDYIASVLNVDLEDLEEWGATCDFLTGFVSENGTVFYCLLPKFTKDHKMVIANGQTGTHTESPDEKPLPQTNADVTKILVQFLGESEKPWRSLQAIANVTCRTEEYVTKWLNPKRVNSISLYSKWSTKGNKLMYALASRFQEVDPIKDEGKVSPTTTKHPVGSTGFTAQLKKFLSESVKPWRSLQAIADYLKYDLEEVRETINRSVHLVRKYGNGNKSYYAVIERLTEVEPKNKPPVETEDEPEAEAEVGTEQSSDTTDTSGQNTDDKGADDKKKSGGNKRPLKSRLPLPKAELLAFAMLHENCDALIRIMNKYANRLHTKYPEVAAKASSAQNDLSKAVAILKNALSVKDKELPELNDL